MCRCWRQIKETFQLPEGQPPSLINISSFLITPFLYLPSSLMATHKRFAEPHIFLLGFPGGSVVKNPPSMHEMWVQFLGQEGPPEKEMVTHSSILASSILSHGERSLVGYSPWGHKRVKQDLVTKQVFILVASWALKEDKANSLVTSALVDAVVLFARDEDLILSVVIQ